MRVDINAIGVLQPDGSILLHDKNIKFREDMATRQRYRLSGKQKLYMSNRGYVTTISSFIVGVKQSGDDLVIAFKTGSQYIYYGAGNLFDNMLKANSKGRYFWRHIRDKIRYAKLSETLDLSLTDVSDEEMFAEMQLAEIHELNAVMQEEIKAKLIMLDGIEYVEFNVGGVVFYNQVGKTIN